MSADLMLIRSYRGVFALDRRIHRLDRWRLPTPYGVPLRGVAYAAAALLAVFLLGRVPFFSSLLGVLHPSLRYVALPIGVGWLLTQLSFDGRSPLSALAGTARLALTPRRIVAFRRADPLGPVHLGAATIAADERWATYRKGTVEGPAEVVLLARAQLDQRGAKLRLAPHPDGGSLVRGKRVRLAAGQRLVVG